MGHGLCYSPGIHYIHHTYQLRAIAALCGFPLFLGGFPSGTQAAQSVALAWDRNSAPGIIGYRLYAGTKSGVYTQTLELGTNTSTLLSNLADGTTYFFAVTDYNAAGVESMDSNEISYRTPRRRIGRHPRFHPRHRQRNRRGRSHLPSRTSLPTPTPTPRPSPSVSSTPSPIPTPEPNSYSDFRSQSKPHSVSRFEPNSITNAQLEPDWHSIADTRGVSRETVPKSPLLFADQVDRCRSQMNYLSVSLDSGSCLARSGCA